VAGLPLACCSAFEGVIHRDLKPENVFTTDGNLPLDLASLN
jgi:serine/threonine protein kinase